MFGIGGMELIVIFLVLLLLFGAKRLPEIARSLGKASNEFKKAKQEFSSLTDDTPEPLPRRTTSAKPARVTSAAEPEAADDNASEDAKS